ncbi:hypothetical protein GDO78_013934 [Eleutherodactylus coqui]|uniref:Uncharacterized protein n=1 Tax=Eleutherodactylus coqui TaxID=57060 RepID=A0A8J6EF52_ELECQ|nr:hypothetical protein GDO78_013934 [Eleutherodactylus coqui]
MLSGVPVIKESSSLSFHKLSLSQVFTLSWFRSCDAPLNDAMDDTGTGVSPVYIICGLLDISKIGLSLSDGGKDICRYFPVSGS